MKHSYKHWMFSAVTLLNLVACHTSNTTLISPIVDPQGVHTKGGIRTEEKFSPKATLLFIIDNSGSMEGHQNNLRKNVNLFVDELGKDDVVDVQVGVTTVYDSVKYGSVVPKVCEETKEILYEENGTLLSPKAPEGKENILKSHPANFIRRGEGFMDLLKETLKVGVKVYTPGKACPDRGPQYEEYFTTIKAAIELAKNGGPNAEFIRGTDSYLVVFLLTDTGDSSTMSAADVYNYLRETRNDPEGKTFTVHAVTDPGHRCSSNIGAEIDKSGKIEKTLELVSLARGTVISMCDGQYGKKLAALGTELRQKVTENMTITLKNGIPEEGTLVLTLGGVKLADNAWALNTSTNVITLNDKVPWSKFPGQTIEVNYVPVDFTRKNTKKLN